MCGSVISKPKSKPKPKPKPVPKAKPVRAKPEAQAQSVERTGAGDVGQSKTKRAGLLGRTKKTGALGLQASPFFVGRSLFGG